jgi:hypothetical protein
MAWLLYALAKCRGRISSLFAMDPGQSSIRTRNCGLDAKDRLNDIRAGIRTVDSRRSMVDGRLGYD